MRKLLVSALSFLWLFSLVSLAQIQNGTFTGTVSDPSGAAIPNAKVTVVNTGTSYSSTTTTNSSGLYTVKELPPGAYRVSAEAQGFKTTTRTDVTVSAGTIQRLDFKMELGQAREIVEVSGEASTVNVEDSKLASTVNATQINNLPLNGRNVYDLMQLAPGAVNVTGVDFENGHNTVVNGLREDFNGFLINGVSNKGLSGGVEGQAAPIQDTVQEFQQLQLNMSAQYGNSAGSINNLVTKTGTNAFHGSGWWYVRNDAFDANQFFLNQQPDPFKDQGSRGCEGGDTSKCYKPALHFNQFGGTLGGAIIKDKLFFFAAYQGDRFNTVGTPQTILVESQQFRDAVATASAAGGPFENSVSNLLFSNFKPTLAGTGFVSLDTYTGGNYTGYLCPVDSSAPAVALATKFQRFLGVTATDISNAASTCALNAQAGIVDRTAPFQGNSVAIYKSQTGSLGNGNLFNGNEGSFRLDFNPKASDRIFAQYNYFRSNDGFGPCNAACTRGFFNPQTIIAPGVQASWAHTFSPTILNEARVGYAQNRNLIGTGIPGVPQAGVQGILDDGTAGFGSYAGYPQTFKEHIYSYSDMVSISHGNHNIKIGADFRRNIENSLFSVARPSYEFFDPLFFAADAPAEEDAGVDPGICAPPCSSFNLSPTPQLAENTRHWRNLEFGAYFQDDWKVTKNFTLNLGIRYDLFTRHNEEDNLATTFITGPGNSLLEGVENANSFAGCPADFTPQQIAQVAQLKGVCGPGGFAPASSLGKGDHNNIGPRVGFAYDVFGDGKMALRGGFGVSYEGTLYNPLSNSRWNMPYYSFNFVDNFLNGDVNTVIYGPTVCSSTSCAPDPTQAPTFSGPPTNPGMGIGAQATGNLTGWAPFSPNQAVLTGIVLPEGIKDPYVYNYFFGVQRELPGRVVIEANYVGNAGHKLFRAENINRHPGSALDPGLTFTDNFGRSWTGNGGFANNIYGNMRNWRNVVNSNYNGLQLSARKQAGRGLMFTVNYTYSHTIDDGSTWHSGATTANGAAAGDGYTTDFTMPQLDRGNSLFDIRHRLVLNYVWQLPGQNLHGVKGALLGGWSYNGIWSFQSGAHWEPFRSSAARVREADGVTHCTQADINNGACFNFGGDYNLDHGRNDRPDSSMAGFVPSRDDWKTGWDFTAGGSNPILSTPCLGCASNLGRNTFTGPGLWYADMSISKIFKFTERVNLKFEAQGLNVFNRANFLIATTGGGAHNNLTDGSFGQAAGTLNARNLQFGLKLSF